VRLTEITLDWLDQVFEPRSRPISGIKEHRILVLDGHSSHTNNIMFIEPCIQQNIHLLCLPAHTTHILQLLDISLFSPLGSYYKQELEDTRQAWPILEDAKGRLLPNASKGERKGYDQ